MLHKTFLLFSAFSIMAAIGNAQNPPLLDRDLFFGNPEISGGQLSPDGKYISFMKAYNGIMNVWVKKFDESFDKAKPITDSKRPLYGYFWTKDGKYILYVKDENGDENINIFAVNPQEAPADGGVPKSRNLTPMKEVTAQIKMVSKKDPDMMMVSINDRDKAWHDLYKLKISTGELTKVYENTERITGFDFDWSETLRLVNKTDEKGNSTIFRKDGEKLTPIYDFTVTEQAYVAGWDEKNTKMYLVTNKGDLDKSTLYLMDPNNKALTKVESDPLNKVDFGGISFDDNTNKIISTSYTDDKTRTYWKDKKWEAMHKYLKSKFPGREVDFQSSTKDYKKFLIAVWGDKFASESYFYNAETKQLVHQYTPRPALKKVEQHLAPMKSITYKSSDGLEIPAYLTLPVGKTKNVPLVMLIHGGPKGPRDTWGYDPEAQFLANRGYAVLQPNFRASGGYGKKFLNAGDLQWGKLMQDDITWGVKHLVAQGIADKSKVAIMGGSYGGYATLAGLAYTPDLYTCGVDIVGPSNIFTLLESVPAYWEAGRAFLYGMVGDPNTEEGKKRIHEASPLFSADKIVKPLLIIQGANDPRVKKAEADQIAIALRDKGKSVSYILADDEGHGFSKPVNKMAMYAEVEAFLASHLGGSFDKNMPADVAKRLGELKVDVSKVTYQAKEKVSSAKMLPKIDNTFEPKTISYGVTIELQGQKADMEMTREIAKDGGNWKITDQTSGMVEGSDAIVYDNNFRPISRKMEQSGQEITMQYEQSQISASAMGQDMNMAVDGAYISDGPGLDMVVAGLPLKNGYSLVFAMPDAMSMKARQMTLTCVGNESVNGVDCTKVEIIGAENENDKIVLWINPNTKMAEKITQQLPVMMNAVMTILKK